MAVAVPRPEGISSPSFLAIFLKAKPVFYTGQHRAHVMEMDLKPVRGRVPYLSSSLQLVSISGYVRCKCRVAALAGEKHQPPVNSPADGYWSTGQWRDGAEPSHSGGRGRPQSNSSKFGTE